MSSNQDSSYFPNFDIPTPTIEGASPSSDPITPSNKKAKLLEHFREILDKDGEACKLACKYCKNEYVYKKGSGYGSYNKHLVRQHPQEIGIGRTQTQLTNFTGNVSNSPLFKYTDQNNRFELVKMISIEHLSFSFGERLGFVKYCQNALNPQAKRIPRTTFTRDLKKQYKKEKLNLINIFSNLNTNVSICCDIWSDHWQEHHYMGVTCHWIDDNWLIQKRVICLRIFDESHSANNIFRLLNVILDEYGLPKKIFSIGFDNASANTKSIKDLQSLCEPTLGGKFFHIRCACHILNLAVKDGLKTIEQNIYPIKSAISIIMSRPSVRKDWKKYCVNNGKKPKKFIKDVPHRWNSTYDLLESSYKYSNLLCSFFMSHHTYVELHPNHWNVSMNMLKVLKNFKDASCLLSGVYYSTSHLFLMEACSIVEILTQYQDDYILKNSIIDMMDKWLAYYEKIPPIYLIATILDPRIKFEGMEQILKNYYEMINKFFAYSSIDKFINVHEYIDEVRYLINGLYNEIFSIFGHQVPTTSTTSSGGSQEATSTTGSISYGKKMLHMLKKQRGGSSTELDMYLTTTFEFGEDSYETGFNVLEWWKQKAQAYPILSIMVKQVFAVPASTVAVEQLFSASGIILDEKRSSLSYDSLEIQTLLSDWYKAENRDQEIKLSQDGDTSDASTLSCSSSNKSDTDNEGEEYDYDF